MTLWTPLILVVVSVLAVVSIILVIRALPKRTPYSEEERREMTGAPMPVLQKRAWSGLLVSSATLVTISIILVRRGAAEYWENDNLRLMVVGVFLVGVVGYTLVSAIAAAIAERRGELDERDRAILSRAPRVQSATLLIALAVWLVSLQQMFRDEGAVPTVYLYLMFGSIIIISLIAESLGILLGYWLKLGDGKG